MADPALSNGLRPRRESPPLGGFAIIDKPAGWTSHDVVAKLRGIFGTRRVGHAGTLDPMATGVLVCGVDRATRLLGYVSGCDKEYLGTIRLGVATNTDDAEGQIVGKVDAGSLRVEHVVTELAALAAKPTQRPSSVSAIKVAGQRAYRRVRAGEQVELPERPVLISGLELLASRAGPDSTFDLDIRVECSSGTYVRAIARDLGANLGVGGHLTALRRTRVGGFELDLATPVADAALINIDEVCRRVFAPLELSAAQAVDVSHGRVIRGEDAGAAPSFDADTSFDSRTEPIGPAVAWMQDQTRVVSGPTREPIVQLAASPAYGPATEAVRAAFAPTGQAIALVRLRDGCWRPTLVLRPATG